MLERGQGGGKRSQSRMNEEKRKEKGEAIDFHSRPLLSLPPSIPPFLLPFLAPSCSREEEEEEEEERAASWSSGKEEEAPPLNPPSLPLLVLSRPTMAGLQPFSPAPPPPLVFLFIHEKAKVSLTLWH